jgi:hypothetical protein
MWAAMPANANSRRLMARSRERGRSGQFWQSRPQAMQNPPAQLASQIGFVA